MTVTTEQLDIIHGQLRSGKLFCAKYVKVEWPTGDQYYSSTAYSRLSPYRDVKNYTGGAHIQPVLLGEPFENFEINGDIRTENIELTFNDPDGVIKALFKEHGAVKASVYFYYPQADLNHNPWWGQLLPPEQEGRHQQIARLTNGFKSPEWFIPNVTQTEECPYAIRFGGQLDTLDKITTNGCPYDIHLGGTFGLLDPATGRPYKKCTGTRSACQARFGHQRFHGGASLRAASTQSDTHPGNVTYTKGSEKVRIAPAKWIFGTKHFYGSDVLIWTRRPNVSRPDEAFVTVLHRIGVGPLQAVSFLVVNDRGQGVNDWAHQLGYRGQSSASYTYQGADPLETYSGIAWFNVTYGHVDANVAGTSLTTRLNVVGYAAVAVYTDEETFTRQWTDDGIWCVLEMYCNQKSGLGYEHERFWITDFLRESLHFRREVMFSFTSDDNELRTFTHRRATFDAALEGKPAVRQISDVCSSLRVSVPFQYDGKYAISSFRAFEAEELDECVVFYDSGPNKNITYDKGTLPVLFEPVPDDKVVNHVEMVYEEWDNYDIPRTIRISDPDQQAKASKIVGDTSFQVVPRQFVATGVRYNAQAVKLGHGILWFGENDEGGIFNNCPVKHVVPYEYTLGLKRYGCYRFELTTMEVPTGPIGVNQVETATAAGTASGSGNITVTITAAGLTGSPIAVLVAITSGDTPAVWAPKVRTALQANSAIDDFFDIRIVSSTGIRLTAKTRAVYDPTMNIAIAAGTTGITAAATSTNTVQGAKDGPWEYFRCLSIRKIGGGLAEVRGIAYNQRVYEAFEVPTAPVPEPEPVTCSIKADCPDGWVCENGVCVPYEHPPICFRTPEVVYNSSDLTIEVTVPPC